MQARKTLLLAIVMAMAFPVASVLAHDAFIGSLGSEIEISAPLIEYEVNHEEDDPFKGHVFVYVKNTGTVPWTDFHFELKDTGYGVENVDWVVTSPYEPVSSQTGLTWTVDNVVVGAQLDLFFAGDPILPGQVATFDLYTDNTTSQYPFFGVCMYPTPEPTCLLLLSLGGLVFFRRR